MDSASLIPQSPQNVWRFVSLFTSSPFGLAGVSPLLFEGVPPEALAGASLVDLPALWVY